MVPFSPFRSRDAKPGAPDNIGHFFLALDPNFFRAGGSFEDDVSEILEYLRATPAVDSNNPVIVAGEPEFARKAERQETGIPLNEAFLNDVRTVATSAGVDFILE